jgi:hypothetical protein
MGVSNGSDVYPAVGGTQASSSAAMFWGAPKVQFGTGHPSCDSLI